MTSRTGPKKEDQPLISIVVVNYNVKEYLAQALYSFQRALRGISHEIYVVDNASVDGSAAYLKKNFPWVNIIENETNVGFARANNQALRLVKGQYIVVINPDTVVQEDTFSGLLEFFKKTPDASAATCKIINPDGSFSVDCRHSIPTPSIALWKVAGLSKLFPRSKIFGQYNLTYLDPDKTYSVPAISGSFMMIKRDVLEKVGLFDERFFMYCEDIDLCRRIQMAGFKIYYMPTTQIIHYKGESTKKDHLDYVMTFNRSLYQFFQKYYASGSLFLFRWLVAIGILIRGIFIYLKNFLRNHFPLLVDGLILNAVIIAAFYGRMEFLRGFYWEDFFSQFWVINFIATLLFLLIAFYLEIYPHHRFSIQSIIKANIFTFILLAFLTFFLKQFAFSRMVVLMTFIASPLLMMLWRAILRRYYRGDKSALGRDLFTKPTVIIGNGQDVSVLYEKLQARREIDYDLIGWVSVDDIPNGGYTEDKKHLGSLSKLNDILRIYTVKQVIFSAHSISYEQILKTMSLVSGPTVEYKMVPSNLEVIIGKSHIEKLDDYPLLEIDYSIGKTFNRWAKRILDISMAVPIFITGFPFIAVFLLFQHHKINRISFFDEKNNLITVFGFPPKPENSLITYWFLIWQVICGKLSLVGYPIQFYEEQSNNPDRYWFKPGLTGLVQINRDKIKVADDAEKYHLFYMKNQSLLLDVEIMLKALWKTLGRK